MIPSSTIDFDVVEARQNGRSAVAGRVLFSYTSPAKLNSGGGDSVLSLRIRSRARHTVKSPKKEQDDGLQAN
jgi:hypothetical protein